MSKMSTNNSRSDLFLELGELSLWFDKRQGQLFAFGTEFKRHRPTEIILRRLSTRKKKGLTAVRYYNKFVYTLRKKDPDLSTIYHALMNADLLLDFYLADRNCVLVPPKFFRGLGSNPDGTILYPNNTMLLWEFSTKSNVMYHRLIEGKLSAYNRNLEQIEKRFNARAIVVFVLEISREMVQGYIKKWKPVGHFYFIDLETFKSIPRGFALTTSAYFWTDGKEYPLKNA